MSAIQQITTPRGTLNWVTISGKGKTDLNGRDIYTVDLVLTPEEAAPLLNSIEEFWEDNKPKNAKAPKSNGAKELDDGNYRFVFKTATTYPSGDAKKIDVYDAKGRVTDLGDKRIGNGSVGRVAGAMAIYDAGVAARGVTLYLDKVQISKLLEYTGGSAGFGEDPDGDFDGGNAFDEELI